MPEALSLHSPLHSSTIKHASSRAQKDVVVIATRRILRPPKKGFAVQLPRSRTLTSVHEAMLMECCGSC